jgi:hypothetical protein
LLHRKRDTELDEASVEEWIPRLESERRCGLVNEFERVLVNGPEE